MGTFPGGVVPAGHHDLTETPRHGYQGDRAPAPLPNGPLGLTVAVSREAGARGGSIARRAGKKLGWQVYDQEHLEFLAADEIARSHVMVDVPADAAAWADAQLERLRRDAVINPDADLGALPRLILTLAARGRVVLVGRGAGYLLPPETTLHVRVVAPLEERVAYMSQLLRLPYDEAAGHVRQRDQKRTEFLETHFRRRPGDACDYDLILNSFLLGEELSADLIGVAAKGKAGHGKDEE